jgi:hypothetical protein
MPDAARHRHAALPQSDQAGAAARKPLFAAVTLAFLDQPPASGA